MGAIAAGAFGGLFDGVVVQPFGFGVIDVVGIAGLAAVAAVFRAVARLGVKDRAEVHGLAQEMVAHPLGGGEQGGGALAANLHIQ